MSAPRGPEPAGASDADAVLADWVADLVERLEAGEAVDLDALAEDHPERAEELAQVLPTIRRMVSFGRAMAGPTGGKQAAHRPGAQAELGSLGDFRLMREVGRGGMGIVYEAEQISLQRRVALKVLPLAAAMDPRHHQRFLLEARAAACLHHTHIVPVHAVGSERGVPYYAMQFIDGCTLAQVLEQLRGHGREGLTEGPDGALAVGSEGWLLATSPGTSSRDREYIRAVAEHGRRAAEALDHAHSRGVLHRDIKPANLMLDAEGRLWITDFGLAQIQGDSRLTLTGDVLGTLRYMSPEQALAKRVVIDGRTDIYSLGATLYELLSLQPVFDGADRAEVLRKIAQDEPTPLRKLNPDVSRDLETIVHKALAKEPADRYPTARELADDLGRFLDARAITARPPSWLERLGKWARRNRAVVAPAVVFVVLALAALSGGLIWSNNWLIRHNGRLRIERDRNARLGDQLRVQRDLAEERRRIADHHLYAFRIRQAAEALRTRHIEKAQEVLRDCGPEQGEDDLRGFAWHYLWREARKEVAVLSAGTEHVTALALSPDGRRLATGERDGTIHLRDPESGQAATTLRGNPWRVDHLAFSPDGRRLVSVGHRAMPPPQESEALLWEVDSGRPPARLEEYSGRVVEEVGFDARGERLWVLSSVPAPGRLDFWDVRTDPTHPRLTWGRRTEDNRPPRAGDGPIAALEGPGPGFRLHDLVEAVEMGWTGSIWHGLGQVATASPDGRLLAVGTGPEVVLWDVKGGREQARFRLPDLGLYTIRFSPDSRFLACEFTPVDRCDILDLQTGGVRTTLPAVVDPDPFTTVRHLAFSPDGRFFARAVSKQGSPVPTKVRQLEPWREVAGYPGTLGMVDALRFARDGRSLTLLVDSVAVRWNFQTPPEPFQPAGHKDEAWAVAFSGDGSLLATGSDDTDDPETLKLWDVATGRLLRGWKPHEAMTSAVAFQPGGRIIASAALLPNANLRLWDAATGGLLATLDGHTDRVRTVAFSPDGTLLASAGSDRVIRLWDVAARRCVRTLTGHSDTIRQVAFSPDGRTLASAANDESVQLWSTTSGAALRTWPGGHKVAGVAFSPDGGTLAWVREDGSIQRWDMARGQPLAPLHCEYDELRCLAFSADGRTLAAAGKSGGLHLWDPSAGQELLTLDGRPCQVNGLAFAPVGSTLAACWHDGTVRIIRSNQAP